MTSELQQYSQGEIHFSDTGNRFRLWGLKDFDKNYNPQEIGIIGISYHYPERWRDFKSGQGKQPRSDVLESLYEIASRIGVPLVWFGEYDVNYRGIDYDHLLDHDPKKDREVEIGELHFDNDNRDPFTLDAEYPQLRDLRDTIQNLFGTDCTNIGSSKPATDPITGFQHYTQAYLPTAYTIQDIDAFHSRQPGDPTCLIEHKRARLKPTVWTPYPEDNEQYHLMIKTANQANLDSYLIKQQPHRVRAKEEVRFYKNLKLPELSGDTQNIPDGNHNLAEKYLGDRGRVLTAAKALERIRKGANI